MIKASRLLKTPDSTLRIVKVFKEPYRKQVVVNSVQATTQPSPQVYIVKIQSNTPTLKGTSEVKVSCDCHDFRYRCAYCLDQIDALMMEPSYLLTPPDKTNPGCKEIRACKHVSEALRFLIKNNY